MEQQPPLDPPTGPGPPGTATRSSREALLAQQAALADFGGKALRTSDLDALLNEASVHVARGLGCRFAKVLELLPDNSGLLIRAGVGWEPGVVGNTVLGAEHHSAPGHALATGRPVNADDLQTEVRFEVTPVLRRHGVRSMVNVIIHAGGGTPFGVLEVDSQEPRRFTTDDVNFLLTYANLLGAAIERHRAHQLLIAAADEKARVARDKEILLHEVQHRVMNNLQVITSLISIQRRRTRNIEAARELRVTAGRVETLRLLHERLYTAQQVDAIDLASYLNDLCANLLGFHRDDSGPVRLETDLKPVTVGADTAVPLGLIVNEFVTNSLKHAFVGRTGTIRIALSSIPAAPGEAVDRVRLEMGDDGSGLPEAPPAPRGSGIHLIQMLGAQIGAAIEWSGTSGRGAWIRLTFPRLL